LSKNFVKGGYVVVNKAETVKIDSNQLITKKLEELKKRQIVQNVYEEEDSDGFSEGLSALSVQRLVSDEDAEMAEDSEPQTGRIIGGSRQQLIDDANRQAQEIINEASEEAQNIKEQASKDGYDEGHRKGYDEGLFEGKSTADKELEEKKAELERSYSEKERELEALYQNKIDFVEGALVEKLTEIYEKVIGIQLSDMDDAILHILKNSLGNVNAGKSLIIHISRDDYEVVDSQKDELAKEAGVSPEFLELIEDHSLEKNGCLIETESGIFDSGLGTQLDLLKKQLRILSLQV